MNYTILVKSYTQLPNTPADVNEWKQFLNDVNITDVDGEEYRQLLQFVQPINYDLMDAYNEIMDSHRELVEDTEELVDTEPKKLPASAGPIRTRLVEMESILNIKSRKHRDLESWNDDRLAEHVLWWYQDSMKINYVAEKGKNVDNLLNSDIPDVVKAYFR